MEQKFTLVSFEITDGEICYDEHTIFKKDTTNMSENEIISEVYGEYFVCEYRKVVVYLTQEITKEESHILEKLHVTVAQIHY